MKEAVEIKPDFNAQQSIVGEGEPPTMPEDTVLADLEYKSQDLFDAAVKLHKDTGQHIQMVKGARGATFLIGEGKTVRERRPERKPQLVKV